MKLDEWKRNELNRLLMEKFDLKTEKEGLDEMQIHPGQTCAEAHEGEPHDDYAKRIAIRLEVPG